MRRLLLLALLISLAGCDRMFRRADLPEPPPPELARLGLAPGYHVQTMDPVTLDKFCRAWGVNANDEWNKRSILACVVPALKSVILPANATPEQRAHEYAHSFAPHFPGGRGWDMSRAGLIGGQYATTKGSRP